MSKLELVPNLIKIDVKHTWHQMDLKSDTVKLMYPALSEHGVLTLTEEQALQIMQEIINGLISNQREKSQ